MGSIVWLDYSNDYSTSAGYAKLIDQVTWASNLGTTLSNVKLNTGVSVNWNGGWRLPNTVDSKFVWGTNGTTTAGYNITSSEFGHLYYTELLNKGYYDTNGNEQQGWGLVNKGPFSNLQSSAYWFGTEFTGYPNNGWMFDGGFGFQSTNDVAAPQLGMAVRSATVTPTPIPAAAWLMGSGLIGLFGFTRRKHALRS
jgi:hypothetical protein